MESLVDSDHEHAFRRQIQIHASVQIPLLKLKDIDGLIGKRRPGARFARAFGVEVVLHPSVLARDSIVFGFES